MRVCKKCESQLKGDHIFCPECGARNEMDITNPGTYSADLGSNDSKQLLTQYMLSKKLPKVKKKFVITFGLIAILLIGGYETGESLTDKNRLIGQFQDAVIHNDAGKLASLMVTDDKRAAMDEGAAKNLLAYFKDNPSSFTSFMEGLKDQSRAYDETVLGQKVGIASAIEEVGKRIINSQNSDSPISLKKEGKEYLFFDNYSLVVKTYFVKVKTNFNGAKLYLDGKEVAQAETDNSHKELGPILPGKHHIKAVYSSNGKSVTKEQDITVMENQNNDELDLSCDIGPLIKDDLVKLIKNFNDAAVLASKNLDASYYKDYETDELFTSDKEEIEKLKLNQTKYITYTYTMEPGEVKADSPQHAYLTNTEQWNEIVQQPYGLPNGDTKAELKDTITWSYEMIKQDGKWKISGEQEMNDDKQYKDKTGNWVKYYY
jgi:hypothetical protein